MNATTQIAVRLSSILALAACGHSAHAQDKTDISVDRYSCRDLLRDSGPDREVAVAFLHGYIFGKAGVTSLNVEAMRKQSTAFIERCLDDPQANALATMTAVRSSAPGAPASQPK